MPRIELVLVDSYLAAVLLPEHLDGDQMRVVRALARSFENDILSAKRWGCWGALINPGYRLREEWAHLPRPHGLELLFLAPKEEMLHASD